jgi:hypothetical protein
MARWHSANVFESLAGGRRLWRFSARGEHFVFEQETTLTLSEAAPRSAAAKDWQTIFRHKLNVAWLPADKVFLRAVQLPGADAAELTAMVELQLEKFSPLPVTHIVWSLYLLPRQADKPESLQTVIIIIAARAYVEEFLGQLETQGFMADRLEAPGLDQLLAAKIHEDGVWIFIGDQHEQALIAWWCGGALQNLSLLHVPAGAERAALLKMQVEQIAWAGELEGWLSEPPKLHLVASPGEAGYWAPLLGAWADGVEVIPPPPPATLAGLSAERCGRDSKTSLLPQEFKIRYRQQFVDRLWMRALFAVTAIYMIGVLIYFGALATLQMTVDRVQGQLNGISITYTNALRDEAQIRILKDRQELKYAALDCWKAVAENLPDGVTIEDMYFQGPSSGPSGTTGGKLALNGTAQADSQDEVTTFNESLRHAVEHGEPLFTEVSPPPINIRGNVVDWKFTCTLRNNEQ